MSDNKHRILELFGKYLSNTSTVSEEREFLGYVEDPLHKNEIQEILSESFQNQTTIEGLSDSSRKRILNQIFHKGKAEVNSGKIYKLWSRIGVAASILLCLGIALYLYQPDNNKTKTETVAKDRMKLDSSKVYLTLANGDRIAVSDTKEGHVAEQSGITITKTADGQLVYSISNASQKVNSNEYNTVETPKGGQYQINLPDGTKVWLNAVSSLRYPISFASLKERKVILKGEGYFEVSEDKTRPFIVVTDKQEVEVLGTHFNINAYNAQLTKTTLLEGSVKVSLLSLKQPAVLKPGQMAVNNSKEINVSDMQYAYNEIAWKDGYFVFNNANIKDIMRDLSNWYNLEVEYEGDLSNVYFHGNYLRSRDVVKLLRSIELTNKVKFIITPGSVSGKGRRITVVEEKDIID